VLTPFLPPKQEYVISIRLSEVQIKAYRYYLEHYAMGKSGKTRGAQLFNDFQNLSRIWTHPRALQMIAVKAEKKAEKKVQLYEKLQPSVEELQNRKKHTRSLLESVCLYIILNCI
jgi:transcriptional regulator ATRX